MTSAQPFQTSNEESSSSVVVETTIPVPAGKRAIIRFASFEASVARGASVMAWISATLNGTTTYFPLVGTKVAQDVKFAGQDDWAGPQPLTLYADPETDVALSVQTSGAAPIDTWVRLSIAGSLQDV